LQEFNGARFADVSLASVARRAGMSNSSVYYHFSSKDAVWLELHSSATASLLNAISVSPMRDSLHARMAGLIETFVKWIDAEPDYALFYSSNTGGNASVEAGRRHDSLQVAAAIAELLAPGPPANPNDQPVDVRIQVAAVVTEVLLRELRLAVAAGHLDHRSLTAVGEELALRVIDIVPTPLG
jgi:AcrR family transcriptional regulator